MLLELRSQSRHFGTMNTISNETIRENRSGNQKHAQARRRCPDEVTTTHPRLDDRNGFRGERPPHPQAVWDEIQEGEVPV